MKTQNEIIEKIESNCNEMTDLLKFPTSENSDKVAKLLGQNEALIWVVEKLNSLKA